MKTFLAPLVIRAWVIIRPMPGFGWLVGVGDGWLDNGGGGGDTCSAAGYGGDYAVDAEEGFGFDVGWGWHCGCWIGGIFRRLGTTAAAVKFTDGDLKGQK